ncbi:hypothetical protein PV403_23775 [Paenibacillus sp. GYB006]|uniref:hypothetical protein n=1 Tax=Paenibacillus sp. GYB006 TaxID=2994394 RepID=UPI002F966EAE
MNERDHLEYKAAKMNHQNDHIQDIEQDHKTETEGTSSPLTRKVTYTIISILIGIDVLLIALHSMGYYLRLFPPDSLVLSMFIFNSIVLLSMGIIAKIYTIVAAFVPGVIIVFLILYFSHAIDDAHYKTIHSPIGNEAVVIKYSATSLGETMYSYDFYQSMLGGLLLKELNNRYSYMDFRRYDSAEDVLGMNDPTWKDRKHLIFHTASGEHTLRLK